MFRKLAPLIRIEATQIVISLQSYNFPERSLLDERSGSRLVRPRSGVEPTDAQRGRLPARLLAARRGDPRDVELEFET